MKSSSGAENEASLGRCSSVPTWVLKGVSKKVSDVNSSFRWSGDASWLLVDILECHILTFKGGEEGV